MASSLLRLARPVIPWLRNSLLLRKFETRSLSSSSDTGGGSPNEAEITISPYPARPDEPTDVRRARLLYQSRKRGIKETDLILSNFAGQYLASMSESQLAAYDHLLNRASNDWDIYYWVTGMAETPKEFDSDVMQLLKGFARNDDHEMRVQQPRLS